MTTAIDLRAVSKRYSHREEPGDGWRSWAPVLRHTRATFDALRDVDLHVASGETVGLIGRNGAGKTSMLRLLAGVSRPSAGTVTVHGRVAPLLSVGVGFHQEMSGRENVYVNGMLLGLRREQVAQRLEEIVAFAELEPSIDVPVKFYSSGMFMRLGFAVAVHVDPDVLLVDEVLAVGDLAFQLKCFDRMRELKERGTTIIIVSHSMHAIRLLCPRALLLDAGRIVVDGPVEDAIARHHALLSEREPDSQGASTDEARIARRELVGPNGDDTLVAGRPGRLRCRIAFDAPADAPELHLRVVAEDRTLVYESRAPIATGRLEAGAQVDGEVSFTTNLNGGSFRFLLVVTADHGRRVLHEDRTGTLAYLTPVLGTSGVADLHATVTLAGEVLTDHPDVVL